MGLVVALIQCCLIACEDEEVEAEVEAEAEADELVVVVVVVVVPVWAGRISPGRAGIAMMDRGRASGGSGYCCSVLSVTWRGRNEPALAKEEMERRKEKGGS